MLCRAIRGKKKRDPADGAEECAGTLLDQLLQRTAKSIPVVSRCRTRCARRVPFCWVPPMVAKGVGPEERYDVSTGCMHQRDGTCAAMHVMHEIDRCSVSLFCLGVLCRCSVSVFCVGVLGRSRMLATIRSRRNDGGFHRTDPLIRTPVNTADADESLRTRRIRYPDFSLDWLPVWRAVCLLAVFSLASRWPLERVRLSAGVRARRPCSNHDPVRVQQTVQEHMQNPRNLLHRPAPTAVRTSLRREGSVPRRNFRLNHDLGSDSQMSEPTHDPARLSELQDTPHPRVVDGSSRFAAECPRRHGS
jgi:hypothetical protein